MPSVDKAVKRFEKFNNISNIKDTHDRLIGKAINSSNKMYKNTSPKKSEEIGIIYTSRTGEEKFFKYKSRGKR